MSETDVVEFAQSVCEALQGTADLDALADTVCAKLPELPVEHFKTWTQRLVEGVGDRYDRLRSLNVLLTKMSVFRDAVARYHTWRVANTPPSTP